MFTSVKATTNCPQKHWLVSRKVGQIVYQEKEQTSTDLKILEDLDDMKKEEFTVDDIFLAHDAGAALVWHNQ